MSFKTTPNWLQGLGVAIISAVTLYTNSSVAQITPDGTLPNNSNVKLDDNTRIIEGGTIRGGNLFHSFGEFSVPNGSTAFFNNAPDIQNILTRVTGKSISNIDGLIRANGKANLFLLNPNGIIFGNNASLNIGGSFVATTANAIGFGNLGFFSTSNPEAPSPLLTVNPNALLFNQIVASPIKNSSTAPAESTPSSKDALGLRVPDGRSLLLVGGDINMDGGGLNAFGGRVELGGLGTAGTVGLNGDGNNLSLSFPDTVERSDVFLSNGATVNVIAGDGGSIAVNARNLEMTAVSVLVAGIESGLGSDNSRAGNITVNATVAINLNNGSLIANQVEPKANGQGGDINISASRLQISGGAQVSARTGGTGNGGSLRINAQDVQIIGRSANNRFASSLGASAQPNSTGDAGDLTVNTNTLLVQDGAQIASSTFGVGKGGSLSVNAQDVQLIGTSVDGYYPSGLFASAQPNSTGDAGDLTVNTNTLVVRNGAVVSTSTFTKGKGGSLSVNAQDVQLIGTSVGGQSPSSLTTFAQPNSTGDAGNLIIRTNTLLVRDGANAIAGTSGAGKGGLLSVDASDVQVIGRSADGLLFFSGLAANAGRNSTGNAGDFTLTTNTLLVRDEAKVTVESLGTGTAGKMTLNARSIRLNNNASLSASTQSAKVDLNKEQATINIDSRDLIIGRNSNIRTDARGVNVIGGNININADVLAAFENSDITADSDDFRGGNVKINTKGIFGIQFRDAPSPNTSDITATGPTSELSGNVQITTPDIDPTRGLVELPINLVDASRQIYTACTPGTRQFQNTFVATGRGGLPMSPTEPLQDSSTVSAWVKLRPKSENLANTTPQPQPTAVSTTPIAATIPIVEASGWVIDRNGNIELVAQVPQLNLHSPWQTPASCSVSQGGVKYGKTSGAKASN
ncbi:MAG: filamentous hemagglutinin N-terminal domain-containing protein [Nostoc sp. DedSLP03]|uniref:two-partner secretion domain-containing protein n=1 Tax=Nostoc sp. DedSLP03 TaxID=3075400 RepID=UPI002AD4FFB2|nr:filamentous hemagglutinin N-terminal domain-containing protein [Nostoc sp. DedSLP03]MDZ7969782.1 filamentous hemagglutinin N-terminal domain-containing protein [Nostoc sp. DedSLP03]